MIIPGFAFTPMRCAQTLSPGSLQLTDSVELSLTCLQQSLGSHAAAATSSTSDSVCISIWSKADTLLYI